MCVLRSFAPGDPVLEAVLTDAATVPLTDGGFLAFVEEDSDPLRRAFDELEQEIRERNDNHQPRRVPHGDNP